MSTSPPLTPPDWTQPPQKRGMSTGSKVVLILAIIFGVAAVICCGGGIAVIAYFRHAAIDDPAVVRQKTAEITDIEVPGGLQPQGGLDLKVPFSGKPIMTIVVYADQPSDSFVFLASGPAFESQNQAQMEQSINQSLQQKGMGKEGETIIGQTVEKKVQIRGKQASFRITTGKGSKSGKPRISVVGAFPGKEGTAMLILNADAEKYPEETIRRMLESIH